VRLVAVIGANGGRGRGVSVRVVALVPGVSGVSVAGGIVYVGSVSGVGAVVLAAVSVSESVCGRGRVSGRVGTSVGTSGVRVSSVGAGRVGIGVSASSVGASGVGVGRVGTSVAPFSPS